MKNKKYKKTKKNVKNSIILLFTLFLIISCVYIYKINNYIELTQFPDCGGRQMKGYAIKTSKGKVIVIDGGTESEAEQLEKYIIDNGGEVEAWFITHPHEDHAGAFDIIAPKGNIKINKIYMSINDKEWYLENEARSEKDINMFWTAIEQEQIKERIVEPEINDVIKIDSLTAKILGVKNPEFTDNAINNSSMVIQVKVNQNKILFLGDTGVESSKKLIENQGENLKSDIVQMAHHGQNGATEELYKIVNPKICLWPTPEWLWNNAIDGVEDSGPWKTKETRKWMKDLGVEANYIEKDGIQTIRVF